jgi:hypothetical protein
MPIYRLTPIAEADDPNWGRATNNGELVVYAHSTGEACAIAALEEASQFTEGVPPVTTVVQASALLYTNLYTVVRDTSGEFADESPVRVLKATFRFPDNLVVQKQ